MGGSLQDQVILVVGGGGGIGGTVCQVLAQAGAHVAVADLREAQAAAAAELVTGEGRRALALGADITRRADAERVVQETVAAFGRLDGLVNMVGLNVFANLSDLSDDDFDKMMAINLRGPFLVGTAAARVMKEQATGGRMVHFASVTSLFGSPGQAAYAAAKAGLCNLVKSMALEWAPFNIRVNALSPVMTETPINADWLASDPDRKANIARKIPRGRLGLPADFAGATRFLLSAESDFIVGQTLYVDGGTSITHPLIGR